MRYLGSFFMFLLLFFIFFASLSGFDSTDYFPFGAKMAEGSDLPLPMGLGFTYYFQDQAYELSEIAINLSYFDPEEIKDDIEIVTLDGNYQKIILDWVVAIKVIAHNRPTPEKDKEFAKKSIKAKPKKTSIDHAYN